MTQYQVTNGNHQNFLSERKFKIDESQRRNVKLLATFEFLDHSKWRK